MQVVDWGTLSELLAKLEAGPLARPAAADEARPAEPDTDSETLAS